MSTANVFYLGPIFLCSTVNNYTSTDSKAALLPMFWLPRCAFVTFDATSTLKMLLYNILLNDLIESRSVKHKVDQNRQQTGHEMTKTNSFFLTIFFSGISLTETELPNISGFSRQMVIFVLMFIICIKYVHITQPKH